MKMNKYKSQGRKCSPDHTYPQATSMSTPISPQLSEKKRKLTFVENAGKFLCFYLIKIHGTIKIITISFDGIQRNAQSTAQGFIAFNATRPKIKTAFD